MEQEFPFPLEVPTTEDYGDTDIMLLKSYYLDSFKKLLNSFGKQKKILKYFVIYLLYNYYLI